MSEIIERSRIEDHSERIREYRWVEDPGAGFSFDADENGLPIRTEGNAHNFDMLETWIAEGKLIDEGVRVREWSYRAPALLRCDCGNEVSLDHFVNTCECGADYNSSGDRLAPRSQWGEETRESVSDILRTP